MAQRRNATGGRGNGGRGGQGARPSGSSVRRRRRQQTPRSRGLWWLVLLACLVGGGAWWAHRAGVFDRATLERISLPGLRPPDTREVTLYFADPRWSRLAPEVREIPSRGGAVGTMRAVVGALAEGSRTGSAAVLPAGIELVGAYLGRDGLAVLDFEPRLTEYYPGGASGEALTVFALVHSVAHNVPGVERVQILVGGQERETLAGHVKISEPLAPDPQWLEAGPR